MLFDDNYKTVAQQAEGVHNVSGSKFISYIIPISNESAIKPAIARIKELQPDASHYCWASKIATEQAITRFNDDGEPAGSAGRPMLNVILSNQLNNVLIVVVRYFGGTLLGIPGLIAAYKTACLNALSNAEIVKEMLRDFYRIEFPYSSLNAVMKIIKDFELEVLNKHIDNDSSITVGISKQKVEVVLAKLKDHIVKSTYLFTK